MHPNEVQKLAFLRVHALICDVVEHPLEILILGAGGLAQTTHHQCNLRQFQLFIVTLGLAQIHVHGYMCMGKVFNCLTELTLHLV